ncbi:MAG: helix-turn-helix domain-containing protein [Parasphingorhabdus sp.]|uniref:Crp/Fnr family transcriptional regulator n=1 Tax=Parasphingorhabdus sp. TaxID=2709688 RepID=UPI0030034304
MMTSCDQCVVKNKAICSALDPDELIAINRLSRKVSIKAGQALIWEGDDSLIVANVVEGAFKLTSSLEDGREQIIGLLYPSDFVGRPFGDKNEFSVTALADSKVCIFSRSDFDHFVREHPDLEHKLLQRTLAELDRVRRSMLMLGRKTAAERVASFLLEMSERLADASCSVVGGNVSNFALPFGRQQVADILGLTIETVSRQMTQLKKNEVIALPDHRNVQILDTPRLLNIANTGSA